MLAPACLVAAGESVVHQGVQARIGYRKDVAAATTVAAIRTAKFFVFFMAE